VGAFCAGTWCAHPAPAVRVESGRSRWTHPRFTSIIQAGVDPPVDCWSRPTPLALVYVAGFGLDEGESIGALLGQGEPTPAVAHLRVDDQGFAWLPEDDFLAHFAPDVDPTEARIMYADFDGVR
jgi:hypothetical protein